MENIEKTVLHEHSERCCYRKRIIVFPCLSPEACRRLYHGHSAFVGARIRCGAVRTLSERFLLKLLSSVSSNYFDVFRQKMESKADEQMQNLLIRKISRIKMEYFEQSDFYNRFNMARSTAVNGVLRVFNFTNDFVSCLITLIIAASILLGNRIWLVIPVIVLEASSTILWQKVSVLDYKATQINVPEERKLGFLSSLFAKKQPLRISS